MSVIKSLSILFATAIGLLIASMLLRDPPSGYSLAPRPDDEPAATMAGQLDAASAKTPERVQVPDPAEQIDALLPHEFALDVLALDNDDRPSAGTTVWLAPDRHVLNKASTGDDGWLRLRWRGRVPAMGIVLACPGDVTSGRRLRRVTVQSGRTTRAVVRVDASVVIASAGAAITSGFTFRIVPTVHRNSRPELLVADDGWCWFADQAKQTNIVTLNGNMFAGNIMVTTAEGTPMEVLLGRIRFTKDFQAVADVSLLTASPDGLSRVTGLVVDGLGQPVANALVSASREPDRPSKWHCRTGDDGAFELRVPPGRHHLVAGGGAHGIARGELVVGKTETRWDPRLDRGSELRGRLVDGTGAALAKWRVEARPAGGDEPWADLAVTGPAGDFAIPNVFPGPLRVRVFRPEAALPSWTHDLWPDREHVLSVFTPEAGTVDAKPVRRDGQAADRARMRLWNGDDGLRVSGDGGALRAEHVPEGRYRLQLGGPGLLWRDLGDRQVLGGDRTDLGELPLGNPAIAEHARDGAPGIALRRLSPSVLLAAVTIEPEKPRNLPAGTYVVDGITDDRIALLPGRNSVR